MTDSMRKISIIKQALPIWHAVHFRKVDNLIGDLEAILDTPSKHTLWMYIVPLLISEHQDYTKEKLSMTAEYKYCLAILIHDLSKPWSASDRKIYFMHLQVEILVLLRAVKLSFKFYQFNTCYYSNLLCLLWQFLLAKMDTPLNV